MSEEDDDKGGKLRRKRASQARSLIVVIALVGFIVLVSLVKMNHHNKYIPSRKLRRHSHRTQQQEKVEDKALELEPAAGGGRQMAESFLAPDSLYKLSVKDMQGSSVSLEQYHGLVTLIVNVALQMRQDQGHYEELSILQEKFAERGFSVLAFPISDFHQELPNNGAIQEFVQDKYPQVNFPIFGLSSLAENPVYENLQRTSGHKVQWNFYKYLVDRNGKVVGIYNHQDNPLSFTDDIEKALDASDPHSHKLVTH
eukprot:CAMPEP_0113630520 /NCGR_PEP_ID=MMETSP0017_2-20120614/15858_1 /TAXON_ID=2856 /ORGANISM="Cylindrotheca closterium" /LENGTH=254 /DNA_ID=CAMNT_0000540989 /DNA_START=122 /DNA_END=886 /DNA_ORIENTATION=- /assembly_acc=CAM_ASM_000147